VKRTLVWLAGSNLTSPVRFLFGFTRLILKLPNLLPYEADNGTAKIKA